MLYLETFSFFVLLEHQIDFLVFRIFILTSQENAAMLFSCCMRFYLFKWQFKKLSLVLHSQHTQ